MGGFLITIIDEGGQLEAIRFSEHSARRLRGSSNFGAQVLSRSVERRRFLVPARLLLLVGWSSSGRSAERSDE